MKKTKLTITTGQQNLLCNALSKYNDPKHQELHQLVEKQNHNKSKYLIEIPVTKLDLILLSDTIINYIYVYNVGTIDMYYPYLDIINEIQKQMLQVL